MSKLMILNSFDGAEGNNKNGVAYEGLPPLQIAEVFALQSGLSSKYGDDISAQDPIQPIVSSTLRTLNEQGFGIGLSPCSETPVTVVFDYGNNFAGNSFLLTPGQVIWPMGQAGNVKPFRRIQWGLPFGWLGGGLAQIVVFRHPEASISWSTHKEVMFHRLRLPIAAVAAENTVWGPYPLRFPYIDTKRNDGTNQINQYGKPLLSVTPTRTIIRVNVTPIGNAGTIRATWYYDAFQDTACGTYYDIDVPAYAEIGPGTWGAIGAACKQYYTQEYTSGPLVRSSIEAAIHATAPAQTAAMTLYSADVALQSQTMDIIRFGKL